MQFPSMNVQGQFALVTGAGSGLGKSVIFTAQAIANKSVIPQGGGKIVNIASQNGVIGYWYRAAYCSAKARVVYLTRVLALEWAQHKINVNAAHSPFVSRRLSRSMTPEVIA